MTEKLIIAGAGGQGIMVFGRVMAETAMLEDKFVTWLPAYGAEVRGGSAHCRLIISDTEIGSPYARRADALIVMNALSLSRFKPSLKNKGLLILNSSLIAMQEDKNFSILQYPFTELAADLGNIRTANMIALGCFLAKKKILKIESVYKAIENMAPKKELIEINHKALQAGVRLLHRKRK